MKKYIADFINGIFNFQENYLKKKYGIENANDSMVKNHITSSATLTFSSELEKNKEKIQEEIKNLAKENIKNFENLLIFAENEGVKTYLVKNADNKLKQAGEKSGFILPKKGLSALYLNFLTTKSFKFKTEPMFIFENEKLSPYAVLYNFYLWYAFKAGFPGFSDKTFLKVKNLDELEKENFENLNYKYIVDLKQSLARDKEASLFALNFMKEIEGAKNAFEAMKNKENGANL